MHADARFSTNLLKTRVGSLVWTLRTSSAEELTVCLNEPDLALKSSDQLIKDSRVVTLARVRTHSGQRVILRRLNYGKMRHQIRDWVRPSRAVRAFRAAFLLDQAGVPTARALAVAEKRRFGFPLAAYLVTEEIPDSRNLAEYLATGNVSVRAVESVALLIADLHCAGYSHRDLKLGNILIDESFQAFLIDLDGLRQTGKVSFERAAKDLARLWQGAAGYQLTRELVQDFLDHYCRRRGFNDSVQQLAGRIKALSGDVGLQPGNLEKNPIGQVYAERLSSSGGPFRPLQTARCSTVDPQKEPTGSPQADPAQPNDWVQLPGSGVAFVRKSWQESFAKAGIVAVDHFLTLQGLALSKPGLGKRYRARLEVEKAGEYRRVYLKRYAGESFSARWKRAFEQRKVEPPSAHEARIAAELASQGIEVPLPVALGWDFGRTGRQRSFIVSAEVQGQSAEQWARSIRLVRTSEIFEQKKQVAREAALLARRFHGEGWCHRDFYLCHFFIHFAGPRVDLALIDLLRVFRPRWRKWRWRIKDLAQLNYSAEQQGISTSLRLRFAKVYFATQQLGPEHRRWIRQILRKSRSIARHDRCRPTRP